MKSLKSRLSNGVSTITFRLLVPKIRKAKKFGFGLRKGATQLTWGVRVGDGIDVYTQSINKLSTNYLNFSLGNPSPYSRNTFLRYIPVLYNPSRKNIFTFHEGYITGIYR